MTIKKEGTLTGKFVFISGEEYWQTGEIMMELTPQLYLVKIHNSVPGVPASSVLIPTMMMISGIDPAGIRVSTWDFFNTEKDLRSYIKYIESPSETGGKKDLKSRSGDTVVPFKKP